MPGISVIIAARNEEPTIAGVVAAVRAWGRASQIIVVVEGSTDRTADFARAAGATVLIRETCQGKAPAMFRGLQFATGDLIVFLDGDLLHVTSDHLETLVGMCERGEADMVIGFKDRGPIGNRIAKLVPISGQRALRKADALLAPESLWHGYGAEISLNEVFRAHGKKTVAVPLIGLDFRKKISKVGLFVGLWQYMGMWFSVFAGYLKARRAMKDL